MRRGLIVLVCVGALVAPGASVAHELDHPAPAPRSAEAPRQADSGPAGAWEFVGSVATGNPHSDLDFFTHRGETYASVGTLGIGPNGGGQTIVQLTQGGRVAPRYVGTAPTAFCPSNAASTTGLQHDVEATPKGTYGVLSSFNPFADTRDAQLLVDATDAPGRCHDQAALGLAGAPPGGLEIIDVTNPAVPQTIGMTSHIGQAHTVNIDPKRPHIAYAATSDAVSVSGTPPRRENEIPGDNDQSDLDGFELVDLRSCMNFPEGTPLSAKRAACRPVIFRYRWPTLAMAEGHTDKSFVFGCHELEVYPNDRLTCGNGTSLMVLDMAGAFDDNGTPDDFTDDRPRGTPLPCVLRDSSSAGPFRIPPPLQVVDCVRRDPTGTPDLGVPRWLAAGAPSLDGVRYVGSVHHEGGHPSTATDPEHEHPSTEDLAFNHESELSSSGNLLLATDERGGGVTPPGASCAQGGDNPQGNGGVHVFRVDRLRSGSVPATAEEAWQAYARTPESSRAQTPPNGKAIYRAPVRTGAQATVCTAHVFQQIPGQNRIFMGWYSQGTQVIDFVEHRDGTVSLREVAHFIPRNANQWVSHIFKAQENPDGTFTYWGATGDFNLGERGRNAVDVYRVTLPPAPLPADGPGVVGAARVRDASGRTVEVTTRSGAPACVPSSAFRRAAVRTRRGRLTFAFDATAPVTIDLFRQSVGRRIVGERLVRRFRPQSGTARWNGRDRRGRRLGDGFYVARFSARLPNGGVDRRRFALVRRNGRFRRAPAYARRESCGLLRRFKLERPVFGGRTNRALNMAFRLGDQATVTVVVRRGGRVVKRFRQRSYAGGTVHRLRVGVTRRRFPRGLYAVTLTARTAGGAVVTRTVRARRL